MSAETTTIQIDRATMADDFRSAMQGKLSDEQIQAGVDAMGSEAMQSYAGSCTIMELDLLISVKITVANPGKTFQGYLTVGGFINTGSVNGTVYTSDINQLYANTMNFSTGATATNFYVYFFDGNMNLLGNFSSASSILKLTLAGTGGWD